MGAPAIEVEGLRKVFRRAHPAPKTVFDGFDFRAEAGEVVALVGANGSGKTTLLKILATLILPEAGSVRVAGVSVIDRPSLAKSRVSLLIADDRSFYPRLTGRQNLDFFAALLGFDAATASARIAQAAELSGVEDLEKPYQECSTGGKQRLALARCLLNEAEVLLLDEPTRSLDAAAAERFRRLIKNELRALGKTVLFTTHDLAEAKSLADRTAALP